ncbi:hypothetical protein BH23BAC1_BH23BAC1_29620 [soil metagenome]
MKTVLVFKTSVTRQEDILNLQPVLNKNLKVNESWNFDLEDCDKILRVETRTTQADTILAALNSNGFLCEELED